MISNVDGGSASAGGIEVMIDQVRRALAGDVPEVPDVSDAPAVFVGTAADGLVTAEVSSTGTVRSVTIDPVMFSRPLAEVAQAARSAVNHALDARPGAVDFSVLAAEVRAVQEHARRDLGTITQAMAMVAQRMRERDPIAVVSERED